MSKADKQGLSLLIKAACLLNACAGNLLFSAVLLFTHVAYHAFFGCLGDCTAPRNAHLWGAVHTQGNTRCLRSDICVTVPAASNHAGHCWLSKEFGSTS
jgi:hypothetical protein